MHGLLKVMSERQVISHDFSTIISHNIIKLGGVIQGDTTSSVLKVIGDINRRFTNYLCFCLGSQFVSITIYPTFVTKRRIYIYILTKEISLNPS